MKLITQNSVETDFYVDTMIIQTLLSDTALFKNASMSDMASSLIDKVKGYVDNNIDPDNKTASVLSMLAPGVLYAALRGMGLTWLAVLISVTASFFRIDIAKILESIWDKLHGKLKDGALISSSEIESDVHSSVQEHAPAASESDAKDAYKMELAKKSHSQYLCEARIVKLAFVNIQEYNRLVKQARPGAKSSSDFFDFFSGYSKQKVATTSILGKILSWVFKIAIGSAGLLVAGDVVRSLLGKPNALEDTVQKGKEVIQRTGPAPKVSTQTKFKLQPSYHDDVKTAGNWIVSVTNNPSSIESLLVLFAKQVYQGLDGLESKIVTTPSFQAVRNNIVSYNKSSPGDLIVVIPSNFTTEKQIVDYFIDDVVKVAP